MANTIITPTWVTKEAGRIAVNNLKFANNVRRDLDDQYTQAGAKVGFTVNVRLPQRFQTSKGQGLVLQPITDVIVPVTLTDQAHIGMFWSSASWTMEIQMVRDRYVQPAASQLANTIDRDGLSRCYQDVYQAVGTPGTPITSMATYLNGQVLLTNSSVPMDDRSVVISAGQMAAIVGTGAVTANLFNPQGTISDAGKTGLFAKNWLGYSDWYQDQNVFVHTTGTYGGTPLTNGAAQTGSSLITDGWTVTTTTLAKGDIFTIAGVFAVNPQHYGSTGALQQFVVTAPTVTDGSGNSTISISPPIITSGAYQTVTAAPADNAAITVLGAQTTATPQGLGFHGDAFVLAMADLVKPLQGQSDVQRSKELNFSLRWWQSSDIMSDQHPARLDALYGYRTVRPDWAVRYAS